MHVKEEEEVSDGIFLSIKAHRSFFIDFYSALFEVGGSNKQAGSGGVLYLSVCAPTALEFRD